MSTNARIEAMVSNLLLKAGISSPPIDLEKVCQLQGVSEVVDADLGPLLGCTVANVGGFSIKLNAAQPLRRRFSLAHEIAHTILSPHSPRLANRFVALRTTQAGGKLERLCDRIAAELLMPNEWVLLRLNSRPARLATIQVIAREFETSVESAAVRFAQLSPNPAAVLCWRVLDKNIGLAWRAGARRLASSATEILGEIASSEGTNPIGHAYRCDHLVVSQPEASPLYTESLAFGEVPARYVLSLVKPRVSTATLRFWKEFNSKSCKMNAA